MKIGHLESPPVVTPVTTERKSGAGEASASTQAAASGAASAEPSAQVELSAAAAGGLAIDDSNAEFDTDKVNRIAQAIRDGKFTVNPEAIADKLIANAQELLSRTSSAH
jgi:negative regulator of flagellin synthesis FlgM